MSARNNSAVLFCNIGWMEHYRGQSATDQITGGGSYVQEEGMGHEVCNFAEYRNKVYGYVQPPRANSQPGDGQINIDRLGGKGKDFVENVLVIWTATRPKVGSVVIGWYKDATVYRFYQNFPTIPKLHNDNGLHGYRIVAKASDVTLLPVDQRNCSIPRGVKGGMGQANVWFAAAPESKGLVKDVLKLVGGKPTARRRNRSSKTDPDHNAKVESAAVREVWKYYESNSYTLESVEKDNVGWDLEAKSGRLTLKIEVKGLSGELAAAQLSPNEYLAFSDRSPNYRLAIVVNALTSPRLIICRYSEEEERWVVDGDHNSEIIVQTKESAVIRVTN